MKTIIYALCAFSAILLIALVYTALKLRDTESRRKKAAAKAAALSREKRQRSRSQHSITSHYAQERFDEYEQTIEDLERRLAAAESENESLKHTKTKLSEYIDQAIEAGKVHSPC